MIKKISSIFYSQAFKARPLITLLNLIKLIFCIIFYLKPIIKITYKNLNLKYKLFYLNKNSYGGRGLFLYRENIEPLFYLSPKIISKKDNIIIDAGANFGMYSILFASLNKKNIVYSIEPFKLYNETIKFNSNINKLKNIKVINKVLADKVRDFKLNLNFGNTSASIIRKLSNAKSFKVKSVTIDILMKSEKLKKLDFIKLDIEGAEMAALKGGIKSIKKYKPKIALECSTSKEFYAITNFLKKFYYEPYSYNEKKQILENQKKFDRFYTNLFFLNKKHIKQIKLKQ